MGEYLYLVAGMIVVLAFVVSRRGGSSINARDIKGANVVNGTVSGTVTQSIAQPPPGQGSTEKERGDHVAWVIALVGVAIAGAELAHDILK